MRKILSLLLLLLFSCSAPVEVDARGAQQVDVQDALLFRGNVGHTIVDHYGWQSAQIVDNANAAFMGLAQPSRFSNSTIHWTVHVTDHPIGGTSVREELANLTPTQQDESPSSGTKYYAISIYMPSTTLNPWVENTGVFHWFIFSQLHGDDTNTSHAAVATISLASTNDACGTAAQVFCFRVLGGETSTVTDQPVIVAKHAYNQWRDFVYMVKYSTGNDGEVKVWTRLPGQTKTWTLAADINGPNLYMVSGVPQTQVYWKTGVYMHSDNDIPAQAEIYLSPFTRANNFHDAAVGSFGEP